MPAIVTAGSVSLLCYGFIKFMKSGGTMESDYSFLYRDYEGLKKNGMKEGFGTSFHPQFLIIKKIDQEGSNLEVVESKHYEGQWKNDQYNGIGKIYINGLLSFEGNFKDGLKQGPGKVYATNGKVIQEGEWDRDYFVIQSK